MKDALAVLCRPLISRIHAFRDLHKGESCYIFGDGFSLKWFDLGAFNDRISLGCNFIPFHNDFNKLKIEYLSLQEPWWFLPFERTLYKTKKDILPNPRQSLYRQVVTDNPDKTFFINLSNYPMFRRSNIVYTFRHFYDAALPEDFITRKIHAYHGSLRFLVTLAIYMGFRSCHLVGFDYTHVPSRSLHWYEKGEGSINPHDSYNRDFFDLVSEYMNVTTITLDGGSEVLDAVTYKQYTGKEPVYRENTELLGPQYQKAMAAWPDYTIF